MPNRINVYNLFLNEDGLPTLVRESEVNCGDNDATTPGKMARLLIDGLRLGDRAEECLYVLALNARSKVTGVFPTSQGDLSGSTVHPREIFKRALLCNAAAIALAHNHPSGDPTPGETDVKTTKKLMEAGELLGIPVRDHVVVAGERYTSMRGEGLI